MDYAYSDLVERSRQWAQRANAGGWLSSAAGTALAAFDADSPAPLFASGDPPARPLIVAFLGGTGVGKSSLLNRLAGAAIAKAGVERPTSKEVTLYHHHSLNIAQLPPGLPLDKIKLAHHAEDAQRAVVWIDMPDFDSTEHGNKLLVLQWLPHIDILLYVVSPERYRDSKAWRILQAEGGKHAWLFVLNQWDRGRQEQYDDFVRQLHVAGFENPLVMRTVCNGGAAHGDEFRQLQTTITALATGHTVEQLQQRGLQVKKAQLQQSLQQCLSELGDSGAYRKLAAEWQQRWPETAALLQQALDWPIRRKADYYAAREGDLLGHKTPSQPPPRHDELSLWDDWAQNRFEDRLDELILLADQLQLPVNPLKSCLSALREKAAKTVHNQTELAVRMALAKPGNGVQRFFLKTMRIAEIVLPLAAMAWAGEQAFQGFYQSSLTHSGYLGVEFAVHSLLLIGLSWLTPYFIQKKIQPSLQKTALQGLKKGVQSALAAIDAEVAETLRNFERQRNDLLEQGAQLQAGCSEESAVPSRQDDTLSRMLLSA